MAVERRRLTSHRGGWLIGSTAVVVSLFALMLGFSPTMNPIDLLSGKGFRVVMPQVTGLTQVRALLSIENAELTGKVSFAYSATTQRGLVVTQRPGAGDAVARGAATEIVVSRGTSRLTVPDLVGMDESAATSTLVSFGLVADTERVNDEITAKGGVFGQEPQAGAPINGGSSVKLTVSLGPAQRAVPDLARLPKEGALFLLGKAGFTLGTVTVTDSNDVQRDAVVGTDPAVGTMLDRDAKVGIVISGGPAPVMVPNVVGRQQADAAKQLGALGFVIGEVTQPGVAGDPLDGQVLDQTPTAGTALRPGEVISLTVRRAAKPAATVPPATAPPATAAPPVTAAP